jgi:hypothetical protein
MSQERSFRVTARRTPSSGFKAKDLRRVDPNELPQLREQQIAQTLGALNRGTDNLPVGQIISLEPRPHVQQAGNTCLLAVSISIAEAVANRQGQVRTYSERDLAFEATTIGLLARGGMTTERVEGMQRVLGFLSSRLDLSLHAVPTRDPIEMAEVCASEVSGGNIMLINTAAHWTAVYGLDKTAHDIRWLAVDPLRPVLQNYSSAELAQKLVYTNLSGRPDATSAQLVLVELPKPQFRVTQVRPGRV